MKEDGSRVTLILRSLIDRCYYAMGKFSGYFTNMPIRSQVLYLMDVSNNVIIVISTYSARRTLGSRVLVSDAVRQDSLDERPGAASTGLISSPALSSHYFPLCGLRLFLQPAFLLPATHLTRHHYSSDSHERRALTVTICHDPSITADELFLSLSLLFKQVGTISNKRAGLTRRLSFAIFSLPPPRSLCVSIARGGSPT